MKFRNLQSSEHINIKETLFSGQVFNFVETDINEYTGVVHSLLISFRQVKDTVEYRLLKCDDRILKPLANLAMSQIESEIETEDFYKQACNINEELLDSNNTENVFTSMFMKLLDKFTDLTVRRFLTLDINYKEFIPEKLYLQHTGLRLVRNSIVPTIFSFICSQNNNIKRITSMVQRLYSKGRYACRYKDVDFYFFPDLNVLVDIEEDLRACKFGYRSRFIVETARKLQEDVYSMWLFLDDLIFGSESTDENLKNHIVSFDKTQTRNQLLLLRGIGPKVADCILLMGFGAYDVVPIDTHIHKYAVNTFNFPKKSLTKKNYTEIQKAFVNAFGLFAGIVQLYIFRSYLN
ncbi:N-glycosylase/DNA lyase [Nosema granulosis]|uniref:DNA-(apurinic or apyrimidinic site) lyase n=1 Tax=Nosema granulosis TaxID=83296 RepID=A0A9P6H0G8_9MICR|nr:N-glycosylase/DNA lyase [Nosema granulosis]